MNLFFDGQNFPRKLSDVEEYWLYKILPEDKIGYKLYRNKIKNLYVIGYGKFPPADLILGRKDDQPDLTIPPQPVVATGTFKYTIGQVNVSIFEEFEDQIEIDIQSKGFYYKDIPSEQLINRELEFFTYSNWLPGQKHPLDNSELRLIEIDMNALLVISQIHKRIWIHNRNLQTNKFIPVTNFYQEALKILRIHEAKIMTDINYFFLNLNKFSDAVIREAFVNYNRNWKKIELTISENLKQGKENWFKKIVKRLLWKK